MHERLAELGFCFRKPAHLLKFHTLIVEMDRTGLQGARVAEGFLCPDQAAAKG